MAVKLTIKDKTKFPWTEADFADKARIAVKAYWSARRQQAKKQDHQGKKDAGTRGEVTGGQHLNTFAHLFIEVIKAAGYENYDIFFSKPLVLPGYYRAQKKWDIVVTKENNLVAAIELKSQSGSFGNNLNNRSEEILGLARDFWTAYRERAYRILCERLILERDYSATALLASPKDSRDGKFIEPSGELTLYKFSKSLFAHLVAYC